MIPIITDLRNAYEAHDHDAFHATLKRLESMLRYTGPVIAYQATQYRPPCVICGTPYEKHGSAPTCASHDYAA